MIKSVYNYPISQLFDIEASVVYEVPRYQREYTWSKEQWENLFDDLIENELGYFLGSIICINQATDALSVQRLEVVDGQQRLTTISLLFAAIYQALKESEAHLEDEEKLELINLKRKLVLKKGEDQIRVRPQIQNNNANDYRAILSDIGVVKSYTSAAYAGNRKVYRALRYFQSRIKDSVIVGGNGVSAILDLLERVNSASMVKIEVLSHADAYTLFESLNNRGIPLSAIDLIKNRLLARLESIEPGKIDYYFGQWNTLMDNLGYDYSIEERFFRHYYNAFKDDLKIFHNVPIATRSNIIKIYEKLIDQDAEKFLQDINKAGKLYGYLLGRNIEEDSTHLRKLLTDLDRIQGAPGYQLLLHLLVRKDRLELTDDHLGEIADLLVRFFVRRNITDSPPTRDLIRLFMAISEELSGLSGEDVIQEIRKPLIAASADDQLFENKLAGQLYEENIGATRFILCSLAEQGMTTETWVDLWKREGRKFLWTIEHIFPQGKNIPAEWVEMIAQGDEQKAEEYRQANVHKLGNLTVSGFNSALGNKSFIEKRDRKDREGRYVGYRNGLNLNADLVECSTWSIEQIETRTQKLVRQAKNLFSLNGD